VSRRVRPFVFLAALAACAFARPASANRFEEVFAAVGESEEQWWDVGGELRLRGELFYDFDLDRGVTPSGDPLYPVPLGDPAGQVLTYADLRLRTDVSVMAPGGAMSLQLRVDIIDNMALGTTPPVTRP